MTEFVTFSDYSNALQRRVNAWLSEVGDVKIIHTNLCFNPVTELFVLVIFYER